MRTWETVSYCPDRFLQNRAYVLNYGVTGVKLLTRSFYSPARRQDWLTPKGAAGQEKPVPPVPERSQGTKTLTPESFTFFCLGQQPTQAAYACPGQPSTLPARRPHSQGRPRTFLEDYSWTIKAGLDWNLGAMLTYRRPRQRNASEQRNTGSQLSSTTFPNLTVFIMEIYLYLSKHNWIPAQFQPRSQNQTWPKLHINMSCPSFDVCLSPLASA